MSSSEDSLPPRVSDDSVGSSVSSRLQEEYDELLKYAIVMPTYDPSQLPRTLSDLRGSFPNVFLHSDKDSEAETSTVTVEEEEEEGNDDDGNKTPKESTPRAVHITVGPSSFPNDFLSSKIPTQPAKTFEEVKTADLINLNSSSETSLLKAGHDDISEVAYTVTVDQDMTRMESVLDQWTYQLKKNVLAEFSQMKIKVIEQHRHQLQQEKERHMAEMHRLHNEMEGLKELLHTYEQSIERKDQVISNLTRAMQQQRDRFEMLKTFCEWKIRHNDVKRETFASKLAMKHYHWALQRKAWLAWHSIVETKWRSRVEKACQAKAQTVCIELTNDYEAKLASLNEALEGSRAEVLRLHSEWELFEENMKKSFMRGVCALNLEAMTMFQQNEQNASEDKGDTEGLMMDHMASSMFATSIPQEEVYTTQAQAPPPARVVSAERVAKPTQSSSLQVNKAKQTGSKAKTVNAKISGRVERSTPNVLGSSSGLLGLAPPMSSVMVERHQPVNKSTIGHALASKFPRQGQPIGQVTHSRIAGQSGPVISPNIRTVKVVE